MLQHRIEAKWIRYFEVAFALCGVKAGDAARAVARAVMAGVPESSYRAALNATPAVMRTMAQRIPGAQFHCLQGVGHLDNMEQPDSFNTSVLAFLQQHFLA